MTKFNKNKRDSKNTWTLVFVFIIISVFLIILIIFLQQRGQSSSENPISEPVPLAEERVIAAKDNSPTQPIYYEKLRQDAINTKPFENGNYAYDERTKDFRLVCTNPCPISKEILDQEFAAIAYAVSTTRGLTKSDIDSSLMPFEVHASSDSVCPVIPSAAAYMTVYTDSNKNTRGLLCFFYDKINYNREKFPYSTSVHEVVHLFQNGKFPPYVSGGRAITEGMSEMMESFFLKGNERNSFCWKGNDWYGEIVSNPNDPHGTGRQLFFSLCTQYGFDYDDLPILFSELNKRKGKVTETEFVEIMNNIVGKDTSSLFRNAGVI